MLDLTGTKCWNLYQTICYLLACNIFSTLKIFSVAKLEQRNEKFLELAFFNRIHISKSATCFRFCINQLTK